MLEWDERKRTSNIEKHGLDFTRAELLFDGLPTIEIPGSFRAEPRLLTVGVIDDVFVTLVWTWRGRNRRAISFRRSRYGERQNLSRMPRLTRRAACGHGTATTPIWCVCVP